MRHLPGYLLTAFFSFLLSINLGLADQGIVTYQEDPICRVMANNQRARHARNHLRLRRKDQAAHALADLPAPRRDRLGLAELPVIEQPASGPVELLRPRLDAPAAGDTRIFASGFESGSADWSRAVPLAGRWWWVTGPSTRRPGDSGNAREELLVTPIGCSPGFDAQAAAYRRQPSGAPATAGLRPASCTPGQPSQLTLPIMKNAQPFLVCVYSGIAADCETP